VKYAWVVSQCRYWETMTCLYAPLAFLREETCFVKAIGVAYGEGAILSGQMMASGVVDVLVEFAMVLTMVSDAHDEAVEMQNDRPKESDGAREICHDDLHVRDPVLLQVCKHRARGSVGRLFVEVVIANRVWGVLYQSLCPILYDHCHGIARLHRGRVQVGLNVPCREKCQS